MDQHNPIISNHHFKNTISDIHSFEGFVKNSDRKISVRNFGEMTNNGMAGDELNHDSYILIIIYRVKREQLGCFSENDLNSGR